MQYTIRIKKDAKSGWLTGQCEQIPEAISQGKDMEELMTMMKDAIELILECKRDEFRAQLDNTNTKTIVRKLRTGNETKHALKTFGRKHVQTV
jgi:predicted RNase H-like HicB family nuclease